MPILLSKSLKFFAPWQKGQSLSKVCSYIPLFISSLVSHHNFCFLFSITDINSVKFYKPKRVYFPLQLILNTYYSTMGNEIEEQRVLNAGMLHIMAPELKSAVPCRIVSVNKPTWRRYCPLALMPTSNFCLNVFMLICPLSLFYFFFWLCCTPFEICYWHNEESRKLDDE